MTSLPHSGFSVGCLARYGSGVGVSVGNGSGVAVAVGSGVAVAVGSDAVVKAGSDVAVAVGVGDSVMEKEAEASPPVFLTPSTC